MNIERRVRRSRRLAVLLLALVAEILLVGFLVQGTRAWLRDSSTSHPRSLFWVLDLFPDSADTKDCRT